LNHAVDDSLGTVEAGAKGLGKFHVIESVTMKAKAAVHHFNLNMVCVFGENQFHIVSLPKVFIKSSLHLHSSAQSSQWQVVSSLPGRE
jgi:hypothetical protein